MGVLSVTQEEDKAFESSSHLMWSPSLMGHSVGSSAVPTCFSVEVLESTLLEMMPWLILSLGVLAVTPVLGAKSIFMQNSH